MRERNRKMKAITEKVRKRLEDPEVSKIMVSFRIKKDGLETIMRVAEEMETTRTKALDAMLEHYKHDEAISNMRRAVIKKRIASLEETLNKI